MENEPIEIFWTGGWDSTYRVVDLVRQNRIVSPVYVIDRNRPSWEKEIETIENLKDILNNHRLCVGGGKILSINYIELEDVRTDESITNAYQTVRKQIPIGNQYDWLARFAVDHPGSELGIEKPYGEYSGCVDAIERFGKLKKQDISWIIDSDYSSPELCLLFGNFSFPIIRLTELEMVENIKQ